MKSVSSKKFSLVALTFLFVALIVGCEPAGPAEKAGKNLDNAGKDIKDAVNPKGPGEKLGEKVDNATGNK